MRAWRVAVAGLVAVVAGLVMLPHSSAQLPPPPTLPVFTIPPFPTIPTIPPPTMPPPTTTPPPTMPPPTSTPPPTQPPTSLGSSFDQQIQNIIDQLAESGDTFQSIIDELRDLQNRF